MSRRQIRAQRHDVVAFKRSAIEPASDPEEDGDEYDSRTALQELAEIDQELGLFDAPNVQAKPTKEAAP